MTSWMNTNTLLWAGIILAAAALLIAGCSAVAKAGADSGFVSLSVDDFEGYTTYENSTYCKPDPRYFSQVAERFGLDPEECLMVGNDAEEDLAAAKTGMQVFLITDCLINKKQTDISGIPHGSFDNLRCFLKL